ncbi:PREDICTED: nuclear GTPase SLIP-GC-like [Cyprinodon variegatus]|uniref:nuclear GTPase SLIP-GC-like n=1 Tax=Cyprinodon variegatus TaxID=28743 RepID=UPI000742CD73|nr:PREDICTED: nuclear GTPase SLIP-GC-like [Cyprinodon variegatus]
MDEFVQDILSQWELSEWIYRFKDHAVDHESFYYLEDQDINELIPKVGPRVKFKKRLRQLKPLHSSRVTGKRKLGIESSDDQPAAKQQCGADQFSEESILSEVKKIMVNVYENLPKKDYTKLINFLKTKITDLSTDKREMVGVFGKTGAGKSSLINAVIGKANLLPSGDINACTSVMIKVEANMLNKYEAEIEFITKEEWQDEVWSMLQYLGVDDVPENNNDEDVGEDDSDDDDDDDDENDEYKKKLSAVYGKDWRQIPKEKLMEWKTFEKIPEFLESRTKFLKYDSAEMLSEGIAKYTRNVSNQEGGKKINMLYWPLVKCVTIKVPDIPLLQHVTLVDLPGNGDRNKSRDNMWKRIVGKCSTVWIVAELNQAAAEKESWEILKSAVGLLGNGGECQYIHFICTKSDLFEDFRDHSAEEHLTLIQKRNTKAKEEVRTAFSKLLDVKKHFTEDCFDVFTVSSKEYLRGELKESTEIPKLQKFLQDLSDCHSVTLNYVSGAYGILSLIQGTNSRRMDGKHEDVYEDLEKNKNSQLEIIKKKMAKTYSVFENCLSKGVETSKTSYEKSLKLFLYPQRHDKGFHRILKCVVKNGGIYKPKKRKEINLNRWLTSFLTNSIDDEFRKTFPNKGKSGPFNGVINKFSLDAEKLKQKYKDVELQLIFLMTEEERVQSELKKMIRNGKKTVYNSLVKTIQETMQECYTEAAKFENVGALKKMREKIENHVKKSKDTMFEKAKNVMLSELKSLANEILETVENTMKESLELSFKTDDYLLPDVSSELEMVKKIYEELKQNPVEEAL